MVPRCGRLPAPHRHLLLALSVGLVEVTDTVVVFFIKAFQGTTWRSEVSEAER